jgi:hypothetical protein
MTEDLKDLRLCWECVGDAFLRSEIQRRGIEDDCAYCERRQRTFSISEMADEVEIALKEHFYQTPTEPSDMESTMMNEGDYDWERKGDRITFIIEESAQIEREPAEDIQKVLEERHHHFNPDSVGEEPFEDEAHYAPTDVDARGPQASWFHFERILKTQSRYFSRTALETLTSIFEGIADHQTADGHPVVVEAGPNKRLNAIYRARVFQSVEKIEEALKRPDKDIGPPPQLAASAGRMNARGISVFYGATDPLVAIAEVRPPVGSKVIIGRFEFLRTVRLLDVEALRTVDTSGSVFDRSLKGRLERIEFLRWLSRRMTLPVMPDDEPFEYLPTQAVADFLATNANPSLDGILYPSVQGGKDKLNVVLFHKASWVKPLDIPKGTQIHAQLYEHNDDGIEIYPWVWEEVPPKPIPEAAPIRLGSEVHLNASVLDFSVHTDNDFEQTKPVLRLDIESLEVHEVKSVEFKTTPHTVHRHRSEKRTSQF